MGDIERIAKLLRDPAIEKQIAAAIVLGELKAKGPEVTDGLDKLLASHVPPVVRHALEALTRIGAKRSLPAIWPLLTHHDAEVRRAAHGAVTSVGEEGVPLIQKRATTASPEERRALDAVLAELGGDDAFSALLAGLDAGDPEASRAAALAVRHEVKSADAKQRRRYLAATEKFLKAKKTQASVSATVAAVKILGYLEDERATPTLLGFVTAKSSPPAVRTEAIIALRFAAHELKGSMDLVSALLDAAEGPDRVLAQTALHTLGAVDVPARLLKRLAKLAEHSDMDRAQFAIAELGRRAGDESAEALVAILAKGDRRRAELAVAALAGREEAIAPLARTLLATTDADRAWLLRNVLRTEAKKIKPALRKQLLDAALERLSDGERGWEAAFDVARDADPKGAAEALRELSQKLLKAKKLDRAATALGLLTRTEHASDDDQYRLASLDLTKSPRDTHPSARANDDALKRLSTLLDKGYDVGSALRKDRTLDLDHLYYVGFHFAELQKTLGQEMLGEVVKKGGKTKIARMAKNKLALVAPAEA